MSLQRAPQQEIKSFIRLVFLVPTIDGSSALITFILMVHVVRMQKKTRINTKPRYMKSVNKVELGMHVTYKGNCHANNGAFKCHQGHCF